MIRYLLYIFLIFLLPLNSAYSNPKYASINIQVLNPPTKNIKLTDSLNAAIIATIYNDTRPDSLKKIDYPTDSIITVKTALDFKQKLEDSPLYNNYNFPVYNYKRDDSKLSESGLEMGVAKQLAADIKVEYLFTIDIVSTKLWYELETLSDKYKNLATARCKVPYKFIFRYYDIKNNTIANKQIINDTLVIETTSEYRNNPVEVIYNIESGDEAIYLACEQAATTYANSISPFWSDEIRYYFKDGCKDMKKAHSYIENQNWDKAIEIWMECSSSSNLKYAAQACFNMALGSEINGNFDLAIEWLKLAQKKDEKISIKEYENILQKRLNDKVIIDKYLKH